MAPERKLTAFEITENAWLEEIRKRNGLTVSEALQTPQEFGTELYLGTGIDARDILAKFSLLGFVDYQPETGKFVVKPLEVKSTD